MKFPFIINKYIWVLNLVLLALLGWAAARVTLTAVRAHFTDSGETITLNAPAASGGYEEKTFPTSISKIEARNIFKAEIPVEAANVDVDENQTTPVEPLDVELKGILVGPDWGIATIFNKKTSEVLYASRGDEVQPGWKVKSIKPRKVNLQSEEGSEQSLVLDFQKKSSKKNKRKKSSKKSRRDRKSSSKYSSIVKKVSDTEYVIDKDGFDDALKNMNELITQMRLVPNFTQDRQVDGFRVMRIKSRSLFYDLGLRNRDIIKMVNGVVLDDASKGLEIFQTMKGQNRFAIDFERNNKKTTFSYEVR